MIAGYIAGLGGDAFGAVCAVVIIGMLVLRCLGEGKKK